MSICFNFLYCSLKNATIEEQNLGMTLLLEGLALYME